MEFPGLLRWALNVIASVFIRGRFDYRRCHNTSKRLKSPEKEVTSQGMPAASGRQERQRNGFSRASRGTRPCGHLDFRPVKLILDFWLLEIQENTSVLF